MLTLSNARRRPPSGAGSVMRLAVVGSGISGLASAWMLSCAHEVHLFERSRRLGGHTHTVRHLQGGRELLLDTGFIVFNRVTYPNLTRVFDQLGVASRESTMSFAVSCRRPDLEYGTVDFGGFLAQPANMFRPSFLRLVFDLLRFERIGNGLLEQSPDPNATLGDLIRRHGFGDAFGRLYLVPMAAAIWSSGPVGVEAFPRDALLRFFANHGLLKVSGHPRWRTVVGGSSSYIPHLLRPLGDRVYTGAGIDRIERSDREVVLHLAGGARERFDGVVVATHADQALALLAEPTLDERELLGAWSYSTNDTWLHRDPTLMPRRRRAWASWNVLLEDVDRPAEEASITYHLNRLQGLDTPTDYFVTLNPPQPPAPEATIRRMSYRHPTYTVASLATQSDLPRLDGRRRTWFCGAYQRHGFHEDGLVSAMRVAADLGVEL
jgi:uncharacterized protein